MITWEFFAGSRSFSKECELRGWETYTTDNQDFEGINQVVDFFEFDIDKAIQETGKPNIIWFSPPCKYFSIASCGYHWSKEGSIYTPKTEGAKLGLKMLDRINELIDILNPEYFIIENPRGMMRKMKKFDNYRRVTPWYCQYGHSTAKPTDLWTNFPLVVSQCFNGNSLCHHERAPRGAKTGIQGIHGNYQRSIVPRNLINSILDQIEKPIIQGWIK